jgi:Condensation domain
MASSSERQTRSTADKGTRAKGEVCVFPVSFAQERLWFLDQFESGSAFYNIPVTVGLPGRLRRDALKRAMAEMVARHEVLRTTFGVLEGRPVQVIHGEMEIAIGFHDLGQLGEEARAEELRRLATEQAQQPFDLTRGPLLRGLLVRAGREQHLLLLTMHHIISDGWSLGIFFRELGLHYEASLRGRRAELGELPIQYADFAQWQREWLQGAVLEELLSYWRGQLTGAPAVLELPTDHVRPAVQSYRGATRLFQVDEKTSAGLKALSQREGVTLFMTLLAVFKTLLYRYTGQTDMVVGTPIANRNRGELEGLIGFFVNTLVLRTDLSGNPTFRQLLQRTRQVTLGAYEHQDLPFERLVEDLQPERHLNHSPLFQVVFAFQNVPTWPQTNSDERPPDPATQPPPVGTDTAKFDLVVSVGDMGPNLMGAFEYRADLFEAASIERMVAHFQRLLASIVADPERRLSDFQILADTETGGYSPSDFPEAQLNQQDFENLIEELSMRA